MELSSGTLRREEVGRRRFGTGAEAQKRLLNIARIIQDRMLNNLASNYPRDRNTNIAEFYRAIAEEFARLQISSTDINNDRYHEQTRTEYLFQILGDSLFLGEKAINEELNDEEYRAFLLRVRNAYYGGSRSDNIEDAVSDIVGLPVVLKEVYQFLRRNKTPYRLVDTHKIFFDIFMDSYNASSPFKNVLQDLKFFIDLIKPAHVIYDTRLIWTDRFENLRGKCTPSYDILPMDEVVYNATKMYVVTYLLSRVYKTSVETGEEEWLSGIISSIDADRQIITLTSGRLLVYNVSSEFYVRDSSGEDTPVSIDTFSAGDDIRYFATKDSSNTSGVIEDTWLYSGVIANISESLEIITFTDGSKLIYNEDTLVYTRDGEGEYRIDLDDLLISQEIIFKGEKFTGTFDFYNVPEDVQNNSYKQFDPDVIATPYFQENVKKFKDIPLGYTEGYQVVVEDGVAKVKDIGSKFYKRSKTSYKTEKSIYRYSLFVDDNFVKQFSVAEPDLALTEQQAFRRFVDFYGITGIEAPEANYRIDTSSTGELKDANGDALIEAVNNSTEMCDRKAMCQLMNEYEDTRDYFTWPSLKLTSGFIIFVEDFGTIVNAPGTWNVPAAFTISTSENEYTMPLLPVLDSEGNIAAADDLIVYVNGSKVSGAVATLDPWTGVVTLNFIPPYNSTVRVDYYYAKRFPDATVYTEQIVQGTTNQVDSPGEQNLGAEYTILSTGAANSRLTWPFPVNSNYYGDSRDYQVNLFPIVDREGNLAEISDIVTSVGYEVSSGEALVSNDGTSTIITKISGVWTGVSVGDVVSIDASNYLDNTIICGVDSVSGNEIKLFRLISLDETLTYHTSVIHYSEIPGAIDSVRPLLGHIRLNFLPPAGFYVRFDYYFTHYERKFGFVPDEISGYMSDVVFSGRSNYALLVDQGITGIEAPIVDNLEVQKIGYRYRAFDLAHSSVLNSSDTFKTNEFGTGGARGSFQGKGNILNEYNLIFSPEYLTDTEQHIVLNDQYLKKDIDPVTKLNRGTPLFAKTYTDDGHYRNFSTKKPVLDSYTAGITGVVDLKGSFEILVADTSGDIDYNPVCEIEKNERLNLYSDFKVETFAGSGVDLPLSTISEGGRTLPIQTVMIEQYYPNREIRINDYLDYINKLPDEIKEGNLRALKGSPIVKSEGLNFLSLRRGDTFLLQQAKRLYRYIVVDIFDDETAQINRPFELPSGSYFFELERDVLLNIDVLFVGSDADQKYGPLNRTLVLNNDLGFGYGLPAGVLKALPGYGVTGVSYNLDFADPDSDPYPRNPNNPDLNFPAGSQLLSSEIIRADGTSVYYPSTGTYAGLTGPSGAADLGITGPTGGVNPLIPSDDDNPIYNIPSGDTGTFAAFSEAEHRVQWRNWDQEMLIVNIGSTTGPAAGVLEEDPINLMDDLGEGIYNAFWKPSTEEIVKVFSYGTLIKSSEPIPSLMNENRIDWPLALYPLSTDQVELLEAAPDITAEATSMGLMNATYNVNRLIFRELLHDNTFRVVEYQGLTGLGPS